MDIFPSSVLPAFTELAMGGFDPHPSDSRVQQEIEAAIRIRLEEKILNTDPLILQPQSPANIPKPGVFRSHQQNAARVDLPVRSSCEILRTPCLLELTLGTVCR